MLKTKLLFLFAAITLAACAAEGNFKCETRGLPAAREGDYDFIIVGGGTAGAIVAHRLSERFHVLLLETGDRLYDSASLNAAYFSSLMTGADTSTVADIVSSLGDSLLGKKNISVDDLFPGYAPHLQETPLMALFSGLTEANHYYLTTPQIWSQKREIEYPRGNVLGGSSATNTMCYFRGSARDFNQWRDDFGINWGYDQVLPFFKKYENNQDVSDTKVHGHSGLINITISKNHPDGGSPATDEYTKAAIKLGWPKIEDASNPETVYGASDSWQQFVGSNGKRSDSSVYIHARNKEGKVCWNSERSECKPEQTLHVWTKKYVTKLLVDGKRAFGVEYVEKTREMTFDRSVSTKYSQSVEEGKKHHTPFNKWDKFEAQSKIGILGAPVDPKLAFDWSRNKEQYVSDTFEDISKIVKRVTARYEVILSAGTVETAKILLLAGIGPKNHLAEKQIPKLVDLPVGQHTQDHQEVVVAYKFPKTFKAPFSMLGETAKGFPELRKHVSGQRSFYSSNGVTAGLEGSSAGPTGSVPKYHLHHIGVLFENLDFNIASYAESMKAPSRLPRSIYEFYRWEGLLYHSHNCELSQNHAYGRIELRNKDPLQEPFVDPRYGSSEEDNNEMVACIQTVRELMKVSDPQFVGEELEPSKSATTKEALLQFVKNNVWGHHISGSAPMGNCTSEFAVTDERGRVYGVEGLRVADASLFPTVPHGNPAGVVMMIGEKIAQSILDEYPKLPSSHKSEL